MTTCTAPVHGHEHGSAKECECPVHGPQQRIAATATSVLPPTASRPRRQVLTPAQEQFFEDSVAVDDAGDLVRVYHGAASDFAEFDPSSLGRGNDSWGNGFYFTDQESIASGYANDYRTPDANVKEFFLDIRNPIRMDGKGEMSMSNYRFDPAQARKIVAAHPLLALQPDEEDADGNSNPLADYSAEFWDRESHTPAQMKRLVDAMIDTYFDGAGWVETESFFGDAHGADFLKAVQETTGHDGVFVEFGEDEGSHYVAWFPEQMKLTSNANPDGSTRS